MSCEGSYTHSNACARVVPPGSCGHAGPLVATRKASTDPCMDCGSLGMYAPDSGDMATVSEPVAPAELGAVLRAAKRHRGQQSLGPSNALPLPAATLMDTFSWPQKVLQAIGEDGRLALQFWFSVGISLKTHYSGLGCIELAFNALHQTLCKDFELPVKPPRYTECCDISEICRRVLMEPTGAMEPIHCFGDLLDRLPPDVHIELAAMQWPSKHWIAKHGAAMTEVRVKKLMHRALDLLERPHAFASTSKAFCYKHKMRCQVDNTDPEHLAGERGEEPCNGMRFAAAGQTCTDWSLQGDMMGFAGPSAKACIVWVEERRARREPWFLQECVHSPHLLRFIKARLGFIYDIECVTIGPDMLGHPVARPRVWISGLLNDAFVRTKPFNGCLEVFAKELTERLRPDIYFAMDADH
eukprot:1465346-Lingulodinium_polyedra.AAC.1